MVLELGCGNGKTAAGLVRTASAVVALDLSRKGLCACRGAVASPNLSLVEGDAVRLPFVDGSFDHVVAFHVLGHLRADERAQAVEEVFRVLRPGGTALVRAFSLQDLRCGAGRAIEEGTFVRGNGIPCHFFAEGELARLFFRFRTIAMDEVKVPKRYDGRDMVRAEWAGTFAKEDPWTTMDGAATDTE